MSKKKDEKKWLQVGNFLLGVDTNAHGSYVVMKSVSQNWSIRWREDTLMFGMLMGVMRQAPDNDGVREYLHSLAAVMFASTTYLHDLVAASTSHTMPFCEGVVKLLKEQRDYEESVIPKSESSKEDEDSALREVGEMTDIQEALGRLDDGKKVVDDIEPVSDEVLNG